MAFGLGIDKVAEYTNREMITQAPPNLVGPRPMYMVESNYATERSSQSKIYNRGAQSRNLSSLSSNQQSAKNQH